MSRDIIDFLEVGAVPGAVAVIWLCIFRKFSWATPVAFVAAASSFAEVICYPYAELSALEGKPQVFIPMGIVLVIVGLFCCSRARIAASPVQIQISHIQKSLSDTEIAFPIAIPTTSLQTCWHCGKSNAPYRNIQLKAIRFEWMHARFDRVEISAPICTEHGQNLNNAQVWARFLVLPFMIVLSAVTVNLAEFAGRAGPVLGLIGFAFTALGGLKLWTWSERTQTFRLVSISDSGEIAVVRFNDTDRAKIIGSELESTNNLVAAGSGNR